MSKWKTWQIMLLIAACILMNFGGRLLAKGVLTGGMDWPVWLDCFGTVLAAYAGGPVCGALTGLTSGLMYSIGYGSGYTYVYSLIGVVIGITAGLVAKAVKLDTISGAVSAGGLSALLAILIAIPLNVIYNGGKIGNTFGDGVMGYLNERGVPGALSMALGECYVDFLDKILTFLLLYAVIHIVRKLRKKMAGSDKEEAEEEEGKEGEENGENPNPAGETALLALAAFLFLAAGAAGTRSVSAEEVPAEETIDYNRYVQTVYNNQNGLPCSGANAIAETSDGILWIGTYAGLYRYNGREFRQMDFGGKIRNVNCLFVDMEGRLWVGTNDSGLAIVINEELVNIIDQEQGLPANSVRSICQDSDGYYYIGTSGSLEILSLNGGLKRVNAIREINYAVSLTADHYGRTAAVTSDGRLFILERRQIVCSQRLVKDAVNSDQYECCEFDPEGHLLAGSSGNQLFTYDISEGYFKVSEVRSCGKLNTIKDIFFTKDGILFLSADNGLAYRTKDDVLESITVNDFDSSIDNGLMDYQGNMWFVSSRLGVLRLSPSVFKDIYGTAGLESRVVNTIALWNKKYYFGTDRGLDVVNEVCRDAIPDKLRDEFDGVRIRCLYVDDAKSLWLCTHGKGLYEIEEDGTEHHYNSENSTVGDKMRVVIQLSDGTILAGGENGISFIRDHEVIRTMTRKEGLQNTRILTMTELRDGKVLAGTDGGGLALLDGSTVLKTYTRVDGLTSEVILRTVSDTRSGGVFIVTSNGLCFLDEDGTISSLDSFPYYNNYDLWAADEDTFFILSSAGIYVVDRDELLGGAELSYELLDSRRGLNSALTANSWNYMDKAGNLFLACDVGVFSVNTKQYNLVNKVYRMSVPEIAVDGIKHKVERGIIIQIDRGTRVLEFFPEIVDFSTTDPYAGYYLEGYDQQWTILPQSSLSMISYKNLPSGEYTFHLAVFDNSQENILEECTYTLMKPKEIYDNGWFGAYMLGVGALALIGLTSFAVLARMRKAFEKQERELKWARHELEMGNQTILAIANAVDAKDERTSQHSKRVSDYSVLIAKELGFTEKECENLRKAARMHDIGKIGIPDEILKKPAKLTDEEYATMKTHTLRGAEILKDFTLIEHVVDGARYHHERYDGRGYPAGLKGEDIPLYGRIIGVADAFDAMTASRVYRNQMDFGYVLGELRRGKGSQFDPEIVEIMLWLLSEEKIDLRDIYPDMPEETVRALEEQIRTAIMEEKRKAEEKQEEPEEERSAEKPAEKPEEKPMDTPEERSVEKPVEKPADKPEDPSQKKAADQGGETER